MPRFECSYKIDQNTPVLIAGQTASGKSQLALKIAENHGGIIINADAIQVYKNWRILTARPSSADEANIKHKLYGHIDGHKDYSVGTWIKEIKEILSSNSRPIIVGGTGLYFSALTSGLVDIPEISESIRLEANNRINKNGFVSLVEEIDAETAQKTKGKYAQYSQSMKEEGITSTDIDNYRSGFANYMKNTPGGSKSKYNMTEEGQVLAGALTHLKRNPEKK